MALPVRSSPGPKTKTSSTKDMNATIHPPAEGSQPHQATHGLESRPDNGIGHDQEPKTVQTSDQDPEPETAPPPPPVVKKTPKITISSLLSSSSPLSSPVVVPTPKWSPINARRDPPKECNIPASSNASDDGSVSDAPLDTIAVIPRKRSHDEEGESEHTPPPSPPPKRLTRLRERPKRVTTAPPSNIRPIRTRKAPERLVEAEEKKPPKKEKTAKKSVGRVFDPAFVTTNSLSRLVKADVYHMLLEPHAWTSLTAEQQTTLLSMLPQNSDNQALIDKVKAGETDGTRPRAFTMATDCFRTDVAKFKTDLKNGHLAKSWRANAEQASIDRAAGEFDAWKAAEAELWWGQKSNPKSNKKNARKST